MTTPLIDEMPDEASIPPSQRKKGWKKNLSTLAKVLFSVGALAIVFTKIDREQLAHTMKNAHIGWILCALVLLNLGQMVSGMRMRYYFHQLGVNMTPRIAITLNYVGMLFNTVLPGGIGGDGYKAWYAKKHYGTSWPDGIRVMLSNRAAGLLWLMLFTFGLGFFSDHVMAYPYAGWLLVAGMLVTLIGYILGCKLLLKESLKTQWGGTGYSMAIQLMNLVTAWVLLMAVGEQSQHVDYLILFMVACVVAVFTPSAGGAGMRELTFLYGAQYAGLSTEIGVGISMLYYLVNLAASLLGIISFHRLKAAAKQSPKNAVNSAKS